jgi:hypothetical protein
MTRGTGIGTALVSSALLAWGCSDGSAPTEAVDAGLDAGPPGEIVWSASPDCPFSSMAADPDGNVVVFGSGNFLVPDLCAAKFDASGQVLWTRRFEADNENTRARAVAIDGEGNILLTGEFSGQVDFSSGHAVKLVTGVHDGYVAKLDRDGAQLWARGIGASRDARGLAIAADSEGHVLVGGTFEGSYGMGSTLSAQSTFDALLFELDSSGQPLWQKAFGGVGESCSSLDEPCWQAVYDVALTGTGEALFAGRSDKPLDLGGGPINSGEFAGELDVQGEHLWSRAWTGRSAYVLGAFRDGGALVVGLDYYPIGPPPPAGPIATRLDAAGQTLWEADLPVSIQHYIPCSDVALTDDSHALLVGGFDTSEDPRLVSAGGSDAYVMELDEGGAERWARAFGDSGDQAAGSIALSAGHVIVGLTPYGSSGSIIAITR